MALILDPEVILTAILANDTKDEGVSYRDIRRYCDALEQALIADGEYKCFYFGISRNELSHCILDYPSQFHENSDRYYRGSLFKQRLFEYRNRKKINQILKSVACNM